MNSIPMYPDSCTLNINLRPALHRKLSNSRLLLSGGSAFSSTSEASIMAKMAMALGIEKKVIVIESESKDTKD